MLTRYFIMLVDLKKIKNNLVICHEHFAPFQESIENLSSEETDQMKKKFEVFISEANSSLHNHFK
jgi:hypothetical protein